MARACSTSNRRHSERRIDPVSIPKMLDLFPYLRVFSDKQVGFDRFSFFQSTFDLIKGAQSGNRVPF